MLIKIGDKHKKEMTHEEIVKKHVGGPKVSPIGSGAGITEAIGPNSHAMIAAMANPQFIQDAFGPGLHNHMKARRKELWDNRRISNGPQHAMGMSLQGDYQFIGAMDRRQYITLMWTDPTLFQDEKRLEAYLRKAGLHVKPPTDY